ncbi:DNRLRE domain-containing protein [Streptomyces sp. ISL-96]|uniref:DNRLRE domain-containing protein n=1 Tax=Streptomyces sp. ISL-96 TaxID=2819191 RepID=UPI001BE99C7A|nr:DNRLRE domain-containing protein [Streptomyces sp. ISL-96]MBT2487694.1 DNRLRE domain-containing protein [Streptomyces sp. ISL-96]
MTSRWRRMPGRRSLAAVAAAVVVASGLTYAGLTESRDTEESAKPRAAQPRTPLNEADAAVRAAKKRKPVEATALRTAYSTTWAQPDGSLMRRIHSSPIRAKTDGVWKAIDSDLKRVDGGWSPKSTNTAMVFSDGAKKAGAKRASRSSVRNVSLLPGAIVPGTGNTLATITVDGHDIVLTWPETIPTPIIDGPRALYPEILPGADLVLTADDNGFAQLLVVKTRAAAADPRVARLAYGLSSPDLSFSLDPVSGIVSAQDEGGNDVAESPTPLMWDNAGTSALTDGQAGDGATLPPEVLPSESAGLEPPEPDEQETATPEPTDSVQDGDVDDPFNEVLTEATDEAPDPSATEPASTNPPVPAEPTPEPSQTGAAATLSLPALNGPQPDSHGSLVEAHLDAGDWVLIPDQEFLADPDTVYPVFIDPSVSKHTNDWTTAYSRHPNAKFYNGKNFNKGGTHEARVGFESDTWGTSRSFFTIDWDDDLAGATVSKAKLTALNTYSWSCQKRSMSVHLTGTINSKTNWKNAPSMSDGNKIGRDSFAYGWKSSCGDDYVSFDVKSTAQRAVSKGWPTMTIGFKATDEDSQYSWKKFQANGGSDPYVDLSYNRKPNAPTGLDLDPELSCDTTYPYTTLGASSFTLWASASDRDGNLASVNFDLRPSKGGANMLGSRSKVSVGSQSDSARVHSEPFLTGGTSTSSLKLVNGVTYSWRAKSVDKFGASSSYSPSKLPCRFVFDSSVPSPPKVKSEQFPDADASDDGFNNDSEDSTWSTVKFGTAGSFTFKAAQTDVVEFKYGFNQGSPTFSVPRAANAPTWWGTTVDNIKPPLAGPNVLYVWAVDGAQHQSAPTKYLFYVTPRDKADEPGDFTGDDLPDMFIVDGNGNLRMYPAEATPANLAKGTGDIAASMSGAYRGNPAKDPNGSDDVPVYASPPSAYWNGSLITHQSDVYGGDGLLDLVARVKGQLWVYPGDGYGAVNIDKRQQILLPSNAPDPAGYSQLVSSGDATGDGKADFLVTSGAELWALIGYNGATIEKAVRLSSSAWEPRDIVSVMDITGDGVTDLVYRSDETSRLYLRTGKPAAGGGTDLASLGSGAASAGGSDLVYGASGWHTSNVRLLLGTPDVNGDGIPDIWTIKADGAVRFYAGTRGEMAHGGVQILSVGNGVGWKNKQAIG